ncbi:MAG TPA: AMP-binding protein [Anaeromyxobacter sp.]|nr:AMP-binding protein [Anaeromyxobacter sp.]
MNQVVPHDPGELVAVGAAGPRTAAELRDDAGRIAADLARHPPGAVVLVSSDRYHFAAALLGAWAAGHAVRLPPNPQPDAIRAAVAAPDVRAFLHDRAGAGDGVLIPDLLRAPASARPHALAALDRLRVDITTSGSTGAQRTWPKSGTQLVGEARLLGELFGVGRGARVLSTVPPHHIYGLLWGVLLPLRARGVIVREGPLHGEEVAAELARSGATHLVSVPAHLAAVAEVDRLPPVAAAFSSGAPLPAAVARTLRERHGWRVVEIYGCTEAGGIAWRDPHEDACWTPFPDAEVAAGEDGVLQLRSPRLDPAAPRPFTIPDRIEPRDGGRFALLGRVDGVVKVAGKRVSLREVEERLLATPGVRDAAALAQPAPGLRGQEIWIAVAATGQTPATIRERLAGWLDPVALPRRIRILEALPREGTGKLVREKLLALFDGGPGARPAILEPEADEPVEAPPGRESRRLTFRVDPALRWLEGHFPGFPVLPGVVQLDGLVLRQVERIWPDAGVLRAIKRLKFTKLIRPDHRIVLQLERDPAARAVNFTIDGPDGRCASGTFVFGGGAA